MPVPLAAIEKIVKKAGVEKISSDALKELQKVIDEIGTEIVKDAIQAAKRAGRNAITVEDIWIVSGKQKP